MKVDLLFDAANSPQPPWIPMAGTLRHIDAHFWDWVLWLGSKQLGGRMGLVRQELGHLSGHILEPLGVLRRPRSVRGAVDSYVLARERAERVAGIEVNSSLQDQVLPALRSAGVLG